MEGTVRAMTPELRKQAKDRLEILAKQTAEMYGGSAEVEWGDFASPLMNDETATAEAQKQRYKRLPLAAVGCWTLPLLTFPARIW